LDIELEFRCFRADGHDRRLRVESTSWRSAATGPSEGGAEPFAAAIAANLSTQNPEVATETAAFLREQTDLLRAQKKTVKAEYEFFEAEWGPRLLALRLRSGFQIFFALFATVIGVGVVIMIHDAVTSRRLVIEPLRMPATLAARGFDGTITAGASLEELTRLQDATRSSSAALGLSGAWSGNINFDVPETGISIGEISRMLRDALRA
jgi:hypothetical protein